MITTSVARPASRGPGGSRGRRRWPVVAVVAALVGALGVPTPASAAVPPGERQRHAMAASGPGKLVLFGGYGTTGDVKDDTWVWNGTAWQRQRPPTSPSPRYAHAMALYPPTGTVLLHGGLGIEIDFLPDTTWVWNPRAKTWTDVTPPVGEPNPGLVVIMAWDGVSQTVVALDTGSATAAVVPGTWTWDGDSWTREATSVRPLRPWAMAYDAARRKVVAFADDGTWLWDGSASARTWTKHPTTTTPTMNHARLAYDAKRKRVVLFGGESPPKNETWTWDGTAWTQQDPRTDPPGRSRMGMAYHAQSERVVVFGGAATQGSLNDTWTYAANWRRVA